MDVLGRYCGDATSRMALYRTLTRELDGDPTMTLDEFRQEMDAYLKDAIEHADHFKDPYFALKRLRTLYRKFDLEERIMADQVIGEWVLSTESKVRFDALVLIGDFKITKAVPSLKMLATRLRLIPTPMARHELEIVERKIRALEARDSSDA